MRITFSICLVFAFSSLACGQEDTATLCTAYGEDSCHLFRDNPFYPNVLVSGGKSSPKFSVRLKIAI